ncbi:MAG: DUF1987 domain-containing protein [Myxococcota bacterium]
MNFKTLIKQLQLGENQDEVYIKGNIKVPEVYLDKNKGIIQFRGRALPENAKELFIPIFNWIEMYLKTPNSTTRLIFNLEYFNTSSSKMLTEIIKKLKKLGPQGKKLIVEWHYPEDDEDVLESGEAFEEITKINFKYCPYDAPSN